jgi:DNA-binding NarL/FixJ family response regulator
MQIVICDDHMMFAEALSTLLMKRGHKVLAQVSSPEQGLALKNRDEADVWLTDLHFPGIVDTAGVRQLREAMPDVPIVVLTADSDRAMLQQALEDGADGVALKTEGVEEVERLLRRVSAPAIRKRRSHAPSEKAWSHLAKSLGRGQRGKGTPALTAREQDVLTRLWRGESTSSIAKSMGVGVSTVRTHLQHLYVKVGVHSRLELVAYAARNGLLQHEDESSPRTA